MNEQEFRRLVSEMRIAQRGYFKSRAQETLLRSKQLEKQVDEELANDSPSLFDEPPPNAYGR